MASVPAASRLLLRCSGDGQPAFQPLAMDSRVVMRGRSPHPLPEETPEAADTGYHVDHTDHFGLVCGGKCLQARQLARDPAATRRAVRKYHLKMASILTPTLTEGESSRLFARWMMRDVPHSRELLASKGFSFADF